MTSTRKQKAKKRRSRQSDLMSDEENVDIMLGSYSRNDGNNTSEDEMNLDSGSNRPQQSSNVIGEDFRSLLNTNNRENSQVKIETTRMINDERSNQMSRRLNEIKTSLNSQIQDAINNAITEKIFRPSKIHWKCRGELIAPQWTKGPLGYNIAQNLLISSWETEGPVGYNGTPKKKTPKNQRKIVLESVLSKKIVD